MPDNFLTKITTHARHWIRAIMGSVVGIGTLVIEHFTGKPLSWSWFVALVFGGLAWHYRAELEASQKQTGKLPRPFLKYEENRNIHSDASEFFVQVEGEKNAFDLEIVSEPTVGTNHKRIHMQWEIRKGAIGKTPVPVSAQFIQYEIEKAVEVPHYVSPLSSGQIKTFLKGKKTPMNSR